jgi:betaine-homocysteine S-methyltransferase
MFAEMIGWASDEGADFIIGETFYYAEEAYTALEEIKKSGLPSVLTISPMGENIMRDGVSVIDTCKELEQRGADVVGMNCFRGPNTMLPYLREIRKVLKCHMAALPIPYRTTKDQPTFFNLDDTNGCTCPAPHGRTFPTALDPLYCNRYEIHDFAKTASNLGINYLGVCCGAAPMHIREVAEAVGRDVPASRYREKMSNHFMYGTNERIPEHISGYGDKA